MKLQHVLIAVVASCMLVLCTQAEKTYCEKIRFCLDPLRYRKRGFDNRQDCMNACENLFAPPAAPKGQCRAFKDIRSIERTRCVAKHLRNKTPFPTTGSPSGSPTRSPTRSPSGSPTRSPTGSPTGSPTPDPIMPDSNVNVYCKKYAVFCQVSKLWNERGFQNAQACVDACVYILHNNCSEFRHIIWPEAPYPARTRCVGKFLFGIQTPGPSASPTSAPTYLLRGAENTSN